MTRPLSPEEIDALDPGVRLLMCALRAAGWETTDSGDGKSKPEELRTIEGFHVVIQPRTDTALIFEAEALLEWLRHYGAALVVEASYMPHNRAGMLLIREPAPGELDGAQPTFFASESVVHP